MEKLLYIMLIWVVSTTSIYSQTVAGKIVDESNQPIEFANIVCLSLPDSTFIYKNIEYESEYTFLFILLYGGGSAAASTGYGNR